MYLYTYYIHTYICVYMHMYISYIYKEKIITAIKSSICICLDNINKYEHFYVGTNSPDQDLAFMYIYNIYINTCRCVYTWNNIYTCMYVNTWIIKLSKRYECISLLLWNLLQMPARQANLCHLSVYIFIYIFFFACFAQFTLLVYKSLIMVVENFQKYHWIQHTNTQPVVVTKNETNYYERMKRVNLFLIGTFTLFVYISLIIVVENFQKYHWIQQKQTQPVVALIETFDRT